MGLQNSYDNQYLANMLSMLVPDQTLSWTGAMTAIDTAKLAEFPSDPKEENDLKALLKLTFALQQIRKAQADPKIQLSEFQGLAENYFLNLRYEIANVNPLYLFDYLQFVARPHLDVQADDNLKLKIANFELLQRYGDYVVTKCFEKGINPQTIQSKEEELKHIIIASVILEINAILREPKLGLERKLEYAKNFINSWMNHTTNIDLLASFADKFVKDRDLKISFKPGSEMFSFKSDTIGNDIIRLLKARIVDLAIHKNTEKAFQQLISSTTAAHHLLHYPAYARQNVLTSQEKMIIIYMAERGFNLPSDVSNAVKSYYKEAIEQSPYGKVLP